MRWLGKFLALVTRPNYKSEVLLCTAAIDKKEDTK